LITSVVPPLERALEGLMLEIVGAAYENELRDADCPVTVTVVVTLRPAPAGRVQVNELWLRAVTAQPEPPTVTVELSPKFVPLSTIELPPPVGPVDGVMELSTGDAYTNG